MKVVFNGSVCELDRKITPEVDMFIREMESNNFMFTYYAPQDARKNSIEKITLKLKDKILK